MDSCSLACGGFFDILEIFEARQSVDTYRIEKKNKQSNRNSKWTHQQSVTFIS